jgi:hypothetical protein
MRLYVVATVLAISSAILLLFGEVAARTIWGQLSANFQAVYADPKNSSLHGVGKVKSTIHT